MTVNSELTAAEERYQKGITYWHNQIPGLASLFQLCSEGKGLPPELTGGVDELEFTLGLGLLACHTPHDWGGSILPVGVNYSLMGKAVARLEGPQDKSAQMFGIISTAMRGLEPVEPLEQRLGKVERAFTVVGQRAAGKGTVLQLMEEEGVCTAPSSRGLREVARVILQRDATTPELVAMGQRFKEQFGYDVFTRMVLWQMTSLPPDLWRQIAIDGLRTKEEIISFRVLFGERAHVIAVVRANVRDDEKAWEVVNARQQASGTREYASYEDFVRTQQIERERIAGLMEQADDVIVNDASLDDLRIQVQNILQ
ncbi:hypothetical protein HY214_03080 [Candidatus Roizmanbacteria bacterium]|nr:hypothetical protein [Candidatus Roizmanbacteria bacterium]